jgi:hypothetical protein
VSFRGFMGAKVNLFDCRGIESLVTLTAVPVKNTISEKSSLRPAHGLYSLPNRDTAQSRVGSPSFRQHCW